MDGRVLIVCALVAMTYLGGHAVVKKVGPPVKKAAIVVSQPARHPVKDAKAVGGHIYHFFKGDR